MRIKDNKGFTLIELLLTIALLAVISIISFVSINAIINKNKDNECISTVNNIIIAAKEYYSDKRYDTPLTEMTVDYLLTNNYLKGEIIDPYTKEAVEGSNIKVIIALNDDKTIKNVKVTETDGTTEIFNSCKSSSSNVMSGIKITKKPTQSYQINYLLNGGKLGNNSPNTVSYESDVIVPNPTKTLTILTNNNSSPSANTEGAVISANSVIGDQIFEGWSSNASLGLGNNAKTGTNSNPTSRWTGTKTKNEYFKYLRTEVGTITMVANWQATPIVLPEIIKENHDCGWNSDQTSATIEYPSGGNYIPTANSTKTTVNLYSFCELGKYTITANANSGSIATTSGWTGTGANATKIITYGATYGTLPTVKRTGFTLAGWYTAVTGGTKIESSTSMTTGSNHTIYARWTANNLAFNDQSLNDGTYGTAYTSNAFTGAASGTGDYTYTIKSGAPAGATINSTNRKITFTNTTAATTYSVVIHVKDNISKKEKDATMTITINKLSITPNISSCSNKVYDGSTSASCAISLATPKSGDTVTASGTCTFANKNVGNNKTVTCTGITLAGAQAGNYQLSAASASKASAANITKLSITPSVSSCSNKVYDGSTSASCAISLATPKSGDTVTASGTCDFANKNVGNNKTVTCTGITLAGAQAGNYQLSAASASKASAANITKLSLTPSISSCSNKVYDGGTAASCVIGLATLKSGDTVTASGTCTFADKNVGNNKTVTCTGITLAGAQAGNYQLSAASTSEASIAKITKKTITIKAKDQNITYGGAITTGTGQVTISSGALISGDTLVAITLTQSTTNYTTNGTITPSAATIKDNSGSGNAVNSNYTISYSTGVLNINKLALTASISSCSSKVYDGGTSATCTFSLATPKSSDAVGASGTCVFANKNVGNNKAVTCTNITLTGSSAGNYSLNNTSASKASAANITKKDIALGNHSDTYNGDTTYTRTFNTGVASETLELTYTAYAKTTGSYTYATTASSGKYLVTAANGSGATSNYNITGGGTFTINKKALTINAYSINWKTGTSYVRSNLSSGVGSEKIDLTYTPYANNAGTYTYTTSNASGKYTIILSDSANYSIASAGNLTINKIDCPAPTGVAISATGIVTWTNVSVAQSYQISINNSTFTAASNGVDYKSTITAAAGNRTVYVRSVCNSTNYNTPSTAASSSVSVYTVTLAKGTGISSVTGAGNYIKGATVQLNATAASNYIFKKWTQTSGGATVSTVKQYSATITSDWNYTANGVGVCTIEFDISNQSSNYIDTACPSDQLVEVGSVFGYLPHQGESEYFYHGSAPTSNICYGLNYGQCPGISFYHYSWSNYRGTYNYATADYGVNTMYSDDTCQSIETITMYATYKYCVHNIGRNICDKNY